MSATNEKNILDTIRSIPHQVTFHNSNELKLVSNSDELKDLMEPIESVAFRFLRPMTVQDLEHIASILSHTPNLYVLRIYQFGRPQPAARFGPAFGNILHPQLRIFSTMNFEHSSLLRYLDNHRDVEHLNICGKGCGFYNPTSRSCPLQAARFNRPVRIYGPSACVSTMVSKIPIVQLGMRLNSLHNARWSARTLISRFGAGADCLTALSIEIEVRDSNVIATLGDKCRKLTWLKVTMKKTAERTSPRKSLNSARPQNWGSALQRLSKLGTFEFATKQEFVGDAKNQEQEYAWVLRWTMAEGRQHERLKQIKLVYEGTINGRAHDITSRWDAEPLGHWQRSFCTSRKSISSFIHSSSILD